MLEESAQNRNGVNFGGHAKVDADAIAEFKCSAFDKLKILNAISKDFTFFTVFSLCGICFLPSL